MDWSVWILRNVHIGHCLSLPGRGFLQEKYLHWDVPGRATAKSSQGLISKHKRPFLSKDSIGQLKERGWLQYWYLFPPSYSCRATQLWARRTAMSSRKVGATYPHLVHNGPGHLNHLTLGACSLDESNIIGTENDAANTAECQVKEDWLYYCLQIVVEFWFVVTAPITFARLRASSSRVGRATSSPSLTAIQMCQLWLCGVPPKPLRIPQVFVSPRQWTDHWRHCRGGRQALVIKSAPPAIPFDTPVAGMGRAVLKIFPGPGRSEACIPGSDETPQLVLPCSLLLLTSQLFNFFNCAWVWCSWGQFRSVGAVAPSGQWPWHLGPVLR